MAASENVFSSGLLEEESSQECFLLVSSVIFEFLLLMCQTMGSRSLFPPLYDPFLYSSNTHCNGRFALRQTLSSEAGDWGYAVSVYSDERTGVVVAAAGLGLGFSETVPGWWEGSEGKGAAVQAWWPGFDPWGPRTGTLRENWLHTVSMAYVCVQTCTYHTRAHTQIKTTTTKTIKIWNYYGARCLCG